MGWICTGIRPDPGDGCEGIPQGGWPKKSECEQNCLHSANFYSLAVALNKSGVKYPFDKELADLARERGRGPASDEFRKAMSTGANALVANYINFKEVDYKYLTSLDTGTAIYPPIIIQLVSINKDNIDIVTEYCNKLGPDDLSEDEELLCNRVNQISPQIISGKVKSAYVLIQDFDAAQALSLDSMKTVAGYSVHKYINTTFKIKQTTIIPIYAMFGGYGHYITMYIDYNRATDTGQALLLEPHINASWSEDVDVIIQSAFSKFFKNNNITYTSLAMLGCPKGLQSGVWHEYGSCQAWTVLMGGLFILNPTFSPIRLTAQAVSTGGNSRILLDLFVYHLYRKIMAGSFGPIPVLATEIDNNISNANEELNDAINDSKTATSKAALNAIMLRGNNWFWIRGESFKLFSRFVDAVFGEDLDMIAQIITNDIGELKNLIDLPAWLKATRYIWKIPVDDYDFVTVPDIIKETAV